MKANSGYVALFSESFLASLKSFVVLHHSIYPRIPPQGVYFESLVARAFRHAGWPADQVIPSIANTPQHDLLVGAYRLSIKTETGAGTRIDSINITKLCTTETGTWDSVGLIRHTLDHLSRYEHILMLRAVWEHDAIHYQVLEIPLDVLKLIKQITVLPVGKRSGRPSMAADVFDDAGKVFRVHFDGADGKCQIHRLSLDRCHLLLEWKQMIEK